MIAVAGTLGMRWVQNRFWPTTESEPSRTEVVKLQGGLIAVALLIDMMRRWTRESRTGMFVTIEILITAAFGVLIGLVWVLAWRLIGKWWIGLIMAAMLFFMGAIGQWELGMQTLALVTAAVIVSLARSVSVSCVSIPSRRQPSNLRGHRRSRAERL